MATYKLRRFSNPETLRTISREHLLSLLGPHRSFFADRGLALPPPETKEILDYEGLASIFMTPDTDTPKPLAEALFFINEMATPKGMECLLEAAENAGIQIVGTPAPTPGDVAVQVWMENRELLERKHAEQFLTVRRTFDSFGTAVSPVPKYRDPMALTAQMKKDLDRFFVKQKRGQNTKVFPYVRPDAVWFLVRHGDPFKREGAIDEKGESFGVYYWPEKFDVLILDPTEGELGINARNKGEKKEYRKVFGRHLYGNDNFFSVEKMYTLEPLREIGEDVIAPVEGMDQVRLTEVDFLWGGSFNEKEIRKADDIFGAYKARNRQFPAKPPITKACFRVTFSDSNTPRTVTIMPPNVAQFMRDADRMIVKKWMKACGFIEEKGSRRLKQLWSALEQVPDLATVPGEWRSLLGGEHALVGRFFLPTQRIARSAKSTVPGRTCIHEIRQWQGEYLSVCPDGCETTTLPRDEVVIHRIDTAGLGREIAEALDLEVLPTEPVPNLAGVWRIGDFFPLSGYRFPVCLALTGEPDSLRCIVDGLAARGEPFVLSAPTRTAFTHVCADLLKQAKSSFLPLDELLGHSDDGRLALLDGYTPDSVFAEFRATHVPQPKDDDGMVVFPTPPGARWEDVSIRFIDGETISVKVKDQSAVLLYSQMGMIDGRNKKPTKQWELLRDFADEHGIIDWTSRRADRLKKKRKQNLAANLQRFFRIDVDPFCIEGNGWRALFTVDNGE